MICPGKEKNGDVCNHFQKVEAVGPKVNNYEFYTFTDGTPYRYEWLGYDELFGSHYDHYVYTYKKYIPNYSNPSLLTPPSICANQTSEEKMPEAWRQGKSATHATHKALHSEAHSAFRAFTRTYGKKYNHMDEYNRRLLQHTRNMEYVNSHNKRSDKTFTLKINHMGDLHQDEMRMRKGLLGKPDLSGAKFVHTADPNVQIPPSVDWRTQNLVSPVKDQGICGSCWSFSTTGALEGQYAKANGEMIILSQQFLVDCAWNGNEGCDGGFQNLAYNYIQAAGGCPTAVSYGEYKMVNEMCHYNNDSTTAVQISGFNAIQSGNETALAQASAVAGPIAISIDAGHMAFVFYDSGVYYNANCSSTNLDHAVLLIGYGTLNGSDYWLVKNSWSTFWGDYGYVMMARNRDNNCGVATGALYPILA
jgi:C1A family cysteine protease